MNRIAMVVAGLTLASGLSRADAIVLPDAIYTWRTEGDPNHSLCQNPSCQPQEFVSGTAPGGGELTTYSGLAETYPGAPNPLNLLNPFSFASFANGATQEVQSFAAVQYYFEVVDPNGGTGLVPVDIQYSVSASYNTPGGLTEPGGSAAATVAVYNFDNSPTQVGHNVTCFAVTCNQSSSGVLHLMAGPGEVFYLYVAASADGNFPSESGSASADPYIYIDPSVTGYQLALSDGISNVPPGAPSSVPEPASLMLVGPVLLAAFGIRHRLAASA